MFAEHKAQSVPGRTLPAFGQGFEVAGRWSSESIDFLQMLAKHKAQSVLAECCRLLVMGFDVAGRWSSESIDFLQMLAEHKAQSVPRRTLPAFGHGI